MPVEALFTSLDGGPALRSRVLAAVDEAADLARHARVDVHVMTFAFTDAGLADRLLNLAVRRPTSTVRILADWGQGSVGSGRVMRRLVDADLPNLLVRYKHDQPYVFDAVSGRIQWSYQASRGLLHHKTLGVSIDGAPHSLVCGSFNWTGTAARSYENLLVVTAGDGGDAAVMDAVEREFAAVWSDGAASLSPPEAVAHHAAVLDEYRRHPARPANEVVGLGPGVGASGPPPVSCANPAADDPVVAFSSRSPGDVTAANGFAAENRARRLDLHKPGGAVKSVPLTLTTLALDTIVAAAPGERLFVAVYGLSARVPEYGALLDAARRGVGVSVLLDGTVGGSLVVRLGGVAAREGLPIRVRAGSRTMHQKYLVHPESGTVLTGTANMSTDASRRHSEHRIRWQHRPALAARFLADFEAIWSRLRPPFRAPDRASPGRTVDTTSDQA